MPKDPADVVEVLEAQRAEDGEFVSEMNNVWPLLLFLCLSDVPSSNVPEVGGKGEEEEEGRERGGVESLLGVIVMMTSGLDDRW